MRMRRRGPIPYRTSDRWGPSFKSPTKNNCIVFIVLRCTVLRLGQADIMPLLGNVGIVTLGYVTLDVGCGFRAVVYIYKSTKSYQV